MTPDTLFDEFAAGFPARKFSAGLLMAFIDYARHVEKNSSLAERIDAFLKAAAGRE